MFRTGNGHMLLEHYIRRVREVGDERRARLAEVKTPRQALAYQDRVREAIFKAERPRPTKTALNPRIAGTVEARGYRIEKILFESRPDCLVSANLYIPDGIEGQAPGVVGSCGHSDEGKASPIYQQFCIRLVKAGFVTLIIDPFNQGERDQYVRLRDREIVRSCTHAHNMMGKQLELLGEWFGAWRTWDAIRALDYLQTRPEVDPLRIGLTGNSGGGTVTTWTWGVEPRFAFGAPSCFVTTFRHNLENELPADSEQYPPGVIGAGLEMADYMIARAPAPAILLGQKYCFFDRRGLKEAFDEVHRFYGILGAAKKTELFIGPMGHGYSSHNQIEMVRFFDKHGGGSGTVTRRDPATRTPAELFATPKGEVLLAGSTPIFDLIAEKADRASERRKSMSNDALKRRVVRTLGLSSRRSIPHHRCLRATTEGGVRMARFSIETEGDIRVLLRKRLETPQYSHTLDVEKEVHLYIPHVSSEDDLQNERFARKIRDTHPLYALDVRGLGESLPDDDRDFFHAYGMDYMFNGYGLLLGQSLLGRRIHDILGTLDLLVKEGARKVHLYGRGQGAVLAAYAGLLHSRVVKVALKNAPLSYHAWTQTPIVSWPHANIPRGVLTRFDLPDVYRALGSALKLIQPWGPTMKPVTGKALEKAMTAADLPVKLLVRA